MTSVGWMIGGRCSRKQSRWPQGFQQDRYIVIFFRITDKGHRSGCSELILTHTAVVVDNFRFCDKNWEVPAWPHWAVGRAVSRHFQQSAPSGCVWAPESLLALPTAAPLWWPSEAMLKKLGHFSSRWVNSDGQCRPRLCQVLKIIWLLFVTRGVNP